MRPGTVMNWLAVVVLAAAFAWGALLYPQLPEAIPTHWGASGEADAFGERSVWTAFGPLIVGAVMVAFLLALHRVLLRSEHFVPAERRAYDLTLGYCSLSLAAIFAWIALMSWYGLDLGPLSIVAAAFAGLPVLVIVGLHLPAIARERKEFVGPGEPSLNPDYWVWGGLLYRNPDDPRVFVPKPPHTGWGVTVNLASAGGRLLMLALALVLALTLALPFLV